MPVMWPTCPIRRKQPSSSKRLPPPRASITSRVGGSTVQRQAEAGAFEENAMKNRISVNGRNGAFGAHIARPETLPAPAVVVLHEVFGVNADIRRTCDELAEQGFSAVAPDLFWRQEPGVDLSVTSESDWQHGVRLYQAYDRDAGAMDIKDTIDAVRRLPECNSKVALLGYCLGALMAFMTAVRN